MVQYIVKQVPAQAYDVSVKVWLSGCVPITQQ